MREEALQGLVRVEPGGFFCRIFESQAKESVATVLGNYRVRVVADGCGAYLALGTPTARAPKSHAAGFMPGGLPSRSETPSSKWSTFQGSGWTSFTGSGTAVNRPAYRAAKEALAPLCSAHSRLGRGPRPRAHCAKVALESPSGTCTSCGRARFVENSGIPLDLNAVERVPLGGVVGRKSHYGSRFRRAARSPRSLTR